MEEGNFFFVVFPLLPLLFHPCKLGTVSPWGCLHHIVNVSFNLQQMGGEQILLWGCRTHTLPPPQISALPLSKDFASLLGSNPGVGKLFLGMLAPPSVAGGEVMGCCASKPPPSAALHAMDGFVSRFWCSSANS